LINTCRPPYILCPPAGYASASNRPNRPITDCKILSDLEYSVASLTFSIIVFYAYRCQPSSQALKQNFCITTGLSFNITDTTFQIRFQISYDFADCCKHIKTGISVATTCIMQHSDLVFGNSHYSFCRTMLCKRGLCRHAVSVRPSVCVTFVHSVKTNKDIFKFFFSPSGSHTILVFPHQTA